MKEVSFLVQQNLIIPSHVFPSPVYPSLQVHVYVPGPVSVHVANSLQSSCGVPHILISLREYLCGILINLTFSRDGHPYIRPPKQTDDKV